jgi:opacity protein-like surface antigen
MRRMSAVLTLGLCATLLPVESRAAGLDVRFGGFFPRANSSLFHDDSDLYTVSKSDWDGFTGGVEGNFILAKNVELGLSIDGYGRHVDTEYRDYERDNGAPIRQALKLDTIPMGVTLRIVPTSRRAKLAPYLAVGGDFIYWRYREVGDFVDFFDPTLPVIADSFESSGGTFGYHAAGGLRVSLNEDISIVGEGKYTWAKEKDMGEDFRHLELDLSGWTATIGVHVRF